ncbi:MAG TPA: hypothetical protein VLA98_10985, partial [Solirubrobacteraceae bacterium]|nr:hypothetical protein [Solirubrobacteraceae bacterium]
MPEIPRAQVVAGIVAALVVVVLGVRWIREQSPAGGGGPRAEARQGGAGAATAAGGGGAGGVAAGDGVLVARAGDGR